MKKMSICIIMLGMFLSVSFGQEQTKSGLGFEFHTFPSAILMQEGASSVGIFFPMESESLIIEPYISYYSYSSETDYDDYDSNDYNTSIKIWSLTVGILIPNVKGNIRSYIGARIGKSFSDIEETNQDNDKNDTLILAPTVGAEYFISENFTFGGECMYSIVLSENKEDAYTRTTNLTTLIPRFIVRFYI